MGSFYSVLQSIKDRRKVQSTTCIAGKDVVVICVDRVYVIH